MTPAEHTVHLVEKLVEKRTGVDIAAHLTGRVRGHVQEQVARLGLSGTDEYLQILEHDAHRGRALFDDLLASVLVHETFFYRFESQLRALELDILPQILVAGTGHLRIWSAGCSRGPEAYTLAMIALRAVERARRPTTIDVMGTDMCGAFLDEARSGVYEEDKLGGLPPELRDRYLVRTDDGTFGVGRELRSLARFSRHNLLDPPPAQGFHVVSCRNVLMYLRPDERARTLGNLSAALAGDGYLLVGHSESLRDAPDLFSPDRRFALGIYRKASADARSEKHDEPPLRDRAPPPDPRRPGPRPDVTTAPAAHSIHLEGDYDVDRRPEKLESLKKSLGEAIDEGCDVVVEADGATLLDQSTARLIARAVRLVESRGATLVVRARKHAVLRWADRHNLPLEPRPEEAGKA